jgi:hypothetical protein
MTVRVAPVLAMLAVANTLAQQPESPPQARTIEVVSLRDLQQPDVMGMPEPPEPPAGANAWSLHIHTTGGFTGRGVGSVTLSSDGQMVCERATCAPVTVALLKPVATTLTSIVEAAWIRQVPSTLCRDCVQTTIVLKRREGDAVRAYRASWDDSQPAPRELRELRRLVLELRTTQPPQ